MVRGIKSARFFLFCLIFLLFFIAVNQVQAQVVSEPTIIEVKAWGLAKPLVTGLTSAGTEVLIYIDGVYAGLADINQSGSETDDFYYRHDVALPEGTHKIMAIARDKVSLVLSAPSPEYDFVASSLPAPTMIEPDRDTVTGKVKPLIKGLTLSGTFVRVYIDGVYNGKTDVLIHDSGTANFAYRPFLNLSRGWHVAWAIAEDESGAKSKISNILNFRIEEPMPAPTLFTPVVNSQTIYSRPFIVGLAKNDSLIKVFIDHKLDGQFRITNHDSGTANFAYQPFQFLTKGRHLVYATATDNRGKESRWSNIIYFTVKQPDIAHAAQEKKQETVVKIEEPESALKEPIAVISPESGTVEEADQEPKAESVVTPVKQEPSDDIQVKEEADKEIADEEIKELIEEGVEEEEVTTGLINEGEERQGKLRLNLIIFIAFLLGVIAWIFWVNRELIKERRAQAEEGKNETPDELTTETKKDTNRSDSNDNNLPLPPQEQPPLV